MLSPVMKSMRLGFRHPRWPLAPSFAAAEKEGLRLIHTDAGYDLGFFWMKSLLRQLGLLMVLPLSLAGRGDQAGGCREAS